MTHARDQREGAGFTLLVYWGCIVFGLTVPGLTNVAAGAFKHGQPVGRALHEWRIQLFAPGYNLFLIAILNAAPFVLLAVFALFHVGRARSGPIALRRRKLGVLLAALGATAASVWTHLITLWYPDAQGALAYVFLPFVLAGVIPAAYVLGWTTAWGWARLGGGQR